MTCRRDGTRRSRWLGWAVAVGLCCGVAAPVRSASTAPETDPLNHAYAVYLGSGLYLSSGRSVFVLRIAPTFKIRSELEHPFGIGVRLNATFGFYDLDPGDLIDLDFPDRLATFAVVPGVEFPVRIYDNWTVWPFVDFGPATDTAFQDMTLVLGLGMDSRAEFHDKVHVYVLRNELIYAKNIGASVAATEDYSVLRTDLEMRRLVRFKIGKRPFDFGPLFAADWYFDTVLVQLPRDRDVQISERYDLGITIGSSEPWFHLKKLVKVPRLGVAYRFGQGSSSVVFSLRFSY